MAESVLQNVVDIDALYKAAPARDLTWLLIASLAAEVDSAIGILDEADSTTMLLFQNPLYASNILLGRSDRN